MERKITEVMLQSYASLLDEEEKSAATVEKYVRDVRKLMKYLDGREVTKELMIAYKKELMECGRYQVRSINSFLVAANRFLEAQGWQEVRIKAYRVQREAFCSERKELSKMEYMRLLRTAKEKGKIRLWMILQVLCATGMRVGELSHLTVGSVKKAEVVIHNKGKLRKILLPRALQKQLLSYIRKQHLREGIVFRTSSGKAVHRSNIWKEMKQLCEDAHVNPEKVFPHNLRHLFAKTFYEAHKDIAMLASILGHGTIETTRIYIKTTSEQCRKKMERLGLVCSLERKERWGKEKQHNCPYVINRV